MTEKLAMEWGPRFSPRPRTVKLRSGPKLRFDQVDYIPLLVYYLGVFEPHCIAQLRAFAPSGGTVIDVGGNIGVHSLEAVAAVGPEGRVLSIEAMPHHAERIREHARMNSFTNLEVIQSAVGDHQGVVKLGLPANANAGMFRVCSDHDAVEVPLRVIDEIVSEACLDRLDLIKMDIEGSELAALKGARATLRHFKPTILIEINGRALKEQGTSAYELVSLLGELGYEGHRIGRGGLEPLNVLGECDECIFFPKNRSRRDRQA